MEGLSAYIPEDRRHALARGEGLPERAEGAALFADISGFTSLTEALVKALGPRRGTEVLPQQLNRVYDALIGEVGICGGSVIGFSGDAITCWFEGDDGMSATACALGLQERMKAFAEVPVPGGKTISLTLKVAVASGSVRRFLMGDPKVQLIDAIAGETLSRMAAAEGMATKGEVVLDEHTARRLKGKLAIAKWRGAEGKGSFAVVQGLASQVLPSSPPPLPPLSEAQLRPWLLPVVYERLNSGQGDFLTELRPAVALFLRFGGIDYDEDKHAGEKLDAFIRWVQGILSRYEGALIQLTFGDKGSFLYVAFGAPIAHEDDARRAVMAALKLHLLPPELGFISSIQIGLSRGTMRTGAYGGSTRRTYGVLGDEVNLAARLMSEAAPGEILISGRVHQAVAADFAFEPRPPILLKGKAEPLPVFAVTSGQQRRAMRLQEPSYALPMVGRENELQAITEKLELALLGQGQVVGIVAEAGLGKSRLVAEVIRTARRKDFIGYGGACQSDGVNTPYLVWKSICSAFFDVDSELPLRKQLRWLESEIEERAPARLSALPLLSAVLDLPLPDNDFTQALDPQTRKSALHALLEDCLKAAAREEPLLLVFEDLHWIDALSHDLLEEVARATTDLPVFIVLAYRPPQLARLAVPRLEALANFTKITLSELSAAECEQAVRAKLAQLYPARAISLPPELLGKLMARAQGNPFYLEELLNYLHDRGLNPRDPAVFDTLELPDSLQALILSRIDRLSESEKTTLRLASIIGRLFRAAWLPGYYPALGELARVKADLDELDRLEITPLDTPEPELAYLFKHIVTHEVTYESLPYATRARLHERLARYLEATHPDTPLDTLAYHYGQSENILKQREYFKKAGDAAKAAFANETALAYYTRLLPLLEEPAEQVELRLQWGEVLELVGKYDEAETHYREALTLAAGDAARTARCQLALGKLCKLRSDYPAAQMWLEQARQGYEALQDQAGLGQALIGSGDVLIHQGEYAAARQHLEAGLALVREAGDTSGVAESLNWLASVASSQGDYTAARALAEESLVLRLEMGDKGGMAATIKSLAVAAFYQGDRSAARALFEESLALNREMGDKQGTASALNNLGILARTRGDYAAAQMLYEESLTLSREIGDRRNTAVTLHNLGNAVHDQGDTATARTLLEESLALSREIGERQPVIMTLIDLGLVAYSQGDDAAARALLEESLVLSNELGDRLNSAWSLDYLGLVALSQGNSVRAQALHEESLRIRRELGDKSGVARSLHNLGLVALHRDDHVTARALLEESLALSHGLGIKPALVAALVGLAGVACQAGHYTRAACLAAAAENLRAAIQYVLATHDGQVYEKTATAARAALDEEVFVAAWAEGQAMSLEEAVAHALEEVPPGQS